MNLIEKGTDDGASKRCGMGFWRISRHERSGANGICKNVCFKVRLEYGSFDIEGRDFVGEALKARRMSVILLKREGILTSQKPSSAQPEEQYIPRPGVPRWLAGGAD